MVKMVKMDLSTARSNSFVSDESKAISAWNDTGGKIGGATDTELKQALVVVFSFIGLTNFPDKAQETTLLNFMRSNFSAFTLKELTLAFEMAVAGKLNTDTDHYQQFSPAYFARIMNSYKAWVSEVRKQHDKQPAFTPKVSIAENEWRGMVQMTYQNFNSKTNWKLWPVEFYEQLVKDGFIELCYHETQMKEARRILCNEIHTKIAMSKDEGQSKSLEELLVKYREKNKEAEVILLAKQLSVKTLFDFGKTIEHRGFYEQ